MPKPRSLMLTIGIVLAVVGSILIVKPLGNEPLWVQWILGFAFFYLGVPIALVGAAIHFVGYNRGPKNRFSSSPSRR